jgi:DNA primase
MSDSYAPLRELGFPAVASILGISLERYKRRKDEWTGPCPVCRPKTNVTAFSYNDSGRFHCFSCECKGSGAIDLVKLVNRCGFKEAVELLSAVTPSVHPPEKKNTPEVNSDASGEVLKPLAKDTWRKFAVPCEWLEQRMPDAAIRERYGVFAYNNPARKSAYSGRVMIPIRDVEGVLYGYLGRDISDTPSAKYLFPPNFPKSRFLFGADQLWAARPHRILYLVESPFCVLKFAALGLPAVSPFGWSVSPEQLQLLVSLAKGIVYLPDRNKYADCAEQVQKLASRVWVRFLPLPAGIDDPEQLETKEQILAI